MILTPANEIVDEKWRRMIENVVRYSGMQVNSFNKHLKTLIDIFVLK